MNGFGAKRLVVVGMIGVLVVALVIGLWPVHANVFGDASYSCGSGFLHSAHDWNVDSSALEFQRSGDDAATSLPNIACPNTVDNRRDLALLLMGFALAVGLIAEVLLDRRRQPKFGTTLFANRRRTSPRPPTAVRRTPTEESGLP